MIRRQSSSWSSTCKTAKSARPQRAADAARPRRRGDRVRAARVHHASRRRGGCGRWRRGRSSASGCAASACSCPQPRTMRNFRPASGRSCRRWRNWAGPSAATCGSTRAGPRPMPPKFADTRRNWPRSRRTSSWPMAPGRGAVAAGDPHRADRVPGRLRSGRRRLRRQPGAAGRQRHRFHDCSNTA